MVICLERGADLRVAQLMPLPLTVSCFSKIQIGFTFLVPAHPASPGQRAVKRVCVLLLLLLLLQALTSHFLQYQAKSLADVKNVRDTIAVLHRVGRTVIPSCPRVRFV